MEQVRHCISSKLGNFLFLDGGTFRSSLKVVDENYTKIQKLQIKSLRYISVKYFSTLYTTLTFLRLYYNFSTLYTTLPHNLIKVKLVDLIERIFQRKALFILHVMIGMLSSHLMQSEIIIYGRVRKCVTLSPFSKTRVILDLALNFIDKL